MEKRLALAHWTRTVRIDILSVVIVYKYLCSLIRVSEALKILVHHQRIDTEMADKVMTFLRGNPAQIPFTKTESDQRTSKINEVCSLYL